MAKAVKSPKPTTKIVGGRPDDRNPPKPPTGPTGTSKPKA